MKDFRNTLIAFSIIATGCSEKSIVRVEDKQSENDDPDRIAALREAETLVAFGNINFGESKGEVEKKLETTPNVTKFFNTYRYGPKENGLSMDFQYHNGGLHMVTLDGAIKDLLPIEQVLVEKYALRNDLIEWGETEMKIPGEEKYKIQVIVHHVGSRKRLKFFHFYQYQFYYQSDQNNFSLSPRNSQIKIYDARSEDEMNSKRLKAEQDSKDAQLQNARKTF